MMIYQVALFFMIKMISNLSDLLNSTIEGYYKGFILIVFRLYMKAAFMPLGLAD